LKEGEKVLDFVNIIQKSGKNQPLQVCPEFVVKNTKDLMIRGKAFYAVWDEETGLWSKSETRVMEIIDRDVLEAANKIKELFPNSEVVPILLKNYSSGKWMEWQKYCKSLPDNYHELDREVKFANSKISKSDYVSRKLDYNIQEGDLSAYEELMNTLYDPSEKQKIEWIIGSIISGDSKKIQKFGVFYGGPGTGKSTVLNIIQKMFDEYYSMFESKSLASFNNDFALEAFASNPLIAIEHDGDLSRIEDNTKLNSIISHEKMIVNEKFKAKYMTRFDSFILIGTNKPVKITDAKSGLLRRLIDIVPTGNKLSKSKYNKIMNEIDFELGSIANHCYEVYKKLGPSYYDGYIPTNMVSKTNDFYNFMEDNYEFFKEKESVTLTEAWYRYNNYCEDARVPYPFQKRLFKEELKNYFKEFTSRKGNDYSVYSGFLTEKFKYEPKENWDDQQSQNDEVEETWLKFDNTISLLDEVLKGCQAQYATENGIPKKEWASVTSKLGDLDTSKLHYVRVPENLIVIDFDIKNQNGEKDKEANLKAASKWPKTYAELSKSGAGIHLHYFYDGDVSRLSRIYDEDIEIKVFNGASALRRIVTKCNDIPVSMINSGLPLKGEKPVLQNITIKSERDLRNRIQKNLRKEVHDSTKCSMDFIYKLLEEAYEQGLKYDVRDMRPDIQQFALNSTHQAEYCLKLINKMHFCSDEATENSENYEDNRPIIFYDVEVFPNLFIIVGKKQGDDTSLIKMINPTASDVEALTKFKLVGFNNRKYDNHILYARMMGYTEEQLFELSQRIISGDKEAFFGEAYNLSYTDIYDFLSSANKMGLKKWEIKLHIHHHELGLPWDKPVPEDMWQEVADYCCDDVVATEAVWNANQEDWLAREILADLAGLTVNDTTNACTTKIIVGNDRHPQNKFIYTDLSTIFPGYEYSPYGINKDRYNEGTKIVSGKSIYRGEDPGEGGYVYANPGMYKNIALLDIASMHPHSAIKLGIFGEEYTKAFSDLVEARVFIKHGEYDKVRGMFGGKIDKWLNDPTIKPKQLANALKTAINSVYGLTSASFPNKLRDPRNKDNIVAKYGALFMINLKHEVESKGFKVVHIKTDSIKIADATPEIIGFVMNYGKEYGYTFEHEATYSKMCLVNDSVYIAKYAKKDWCLERYGYCPSDIDDKHENTWTATGAQFQVPYVFKTLFSHEPIEFEDLCETKAVTTALYLDMNENLGEDEHDYRFVGRVGSFCPIKPGCGGGVLLREGNGKFSAAVGTKKPKKVSKDEPNIYYWLESEMVRTLEKEDDIDRSYYNQLVDEAIETISKYGDFELFVSDDITDMSWMDISEGVGDEIPFNDAMKVANDAA
jgi:hypothetical protein